MLDNSRVPSFSASRGVQTLFSAVITPYQTCAKGSRSDRIIRGAALMWRFCGTHNWRQAGVDGAVLDLPLLGIERGHHDGARAAASLSASELGAVSYMHRS